MPDTRANVASIEVFGTISGRLTDPFADRKTILAEFGLDEGGWAEQVRTFRQVLSAAKDDTAAFRRYQEAFELARDMGRAAPREAARPQLAEPVASPLVPPSPATPVLVPSYLLPSAKSADTHSSDPGLRVPENASAGAAPIPSAYPFPAPLANVPAPAPSAQPRETAPRPRVGVGTEAVDMRAVEQGIALAAARQSGDAAPVAQSSPVASREASAPGPRFATGTAAVDARVVEEGLALAARARARSGELADSNSAAPPGTVAGSGTVFAPAAMAVAPSIPFTRPTTSPAPIATSGAVSERIATGTVLASPDNASTASGPPTPFASPAESGVGRGMSLEQYAFVQAALRDASPEDIPAVLARFRLTHETRAQLEATWKARMKADPSLAIRYAVALADRKKVP